MRRIGLAVVLNSMSCRMRFCLALLLAIAAAGPPTVAQQATRISKIGFLATTTEPIAAFREGLRELAYIERKTVLLEVSNAGRHDSLRNKWFRNASNSLRDSVCFRDFVECTARGDF
jgi:hypothetical protein